MRASVAVGHLHDPFGRRTVIISSIKRIAFKCANLETSMQDPRMKNSFAPNEDFAPDPLEQGLLSPPGRKPPTAVGSGTLPPERPDRRDEYGPIASMLARRRRMLGLTFVGPIALGLPVGLVLGWAGDIELIGLTLAALAAAAAVHRIGLRVAHYRERESKKSRTSIASRAA